MRARRVVPLLAAALALPLSGRAAGGALVHLADGSSVPLATATLSYEYLAWKQGTPQQEARPQRRDAPELWLAKKGHAVAGQNLEIVYTPVERAREVDGEIQAVKVPVATAFRLGGAKTPLKLEAPHKDLLLGEAGRGMMLTVRTLDLRGETLTGTRREFCLASFTALVECPEEPSNKVVRVEFQ